MHMCTREVTRAGRPPGGGADRDGRRLAAACCSPPPGAGRGAGRWRRQRAARGLCAAI